MKGISKNLTIIFATWGLFLCAFPPLQAQVNPMEAPLQAFSNSHEFRFRLIPTTTLQFLRDPQSKGLEEMTIEAILFFKDEDRGVGEIQSIVSEWISPELLETFKNYDWASMQAVLLGGEPDVLTRALLIAAYNQTLLKMLRITMGDNSTPAEISAQVMETIQRVENYFEARADLNEELIRFDPTYRQGAMTRVDLVIESMRKDSDSVSKLRARAVSLGTQMFPGDWTAEWAAIQPLLKSTKDLKSEDWETLGPRGIALLHTLHAHWLDETPPAKAESFTTAELDSIQRAVEQNIHGDVSESTMARLFEDSDEAVQAEIRRGLEMYSKTWRGRMESVATTLHDVTQNDFFAGVGLLALWRMLQDYAEVRSQIFLPEKQILDQIYEARPSSMQSQSKAEMREWARQQFKDSKPIPNGKDFGPDLIEALRMGRGLETFRNDFRETATRGFHPTAVEKALDHFEARMGSESRKWNEFDHRYFKEVYEMMGKGELSVRDLLIAKQHYASVRYRGAPSEFNVVKRLWWNTKGWIWKDTVDPRFTAKKKALEVAEKTIRKETLEILGQSRWDGRRGWLQNILHSPVDAYHRWRVNRVLKAWRKKVEESSDSRNLANKKPDSRNYRRSSLGNSLFEIPKAKCSRLISAMGRVSGFGRRLARWGTGAFGLAALLAGVVAGGRYLQKRYYGEEDEEKLKDNPQLGRARQVNQVEAWKEDLIMDVSTELRDLFQKSFPDLEISLTPKSLSPLNTMTGFPDFFYVLVKRQERGANAREMRVLNASEGIALRFQIVTEGENTMLMQKLGLRRTKIPAKISFKLSKAVRLQGARTPKVIRAEGQLMTNKFPVWIDPQFADSAFR